MIELIKFNGLILKLSSHRHAFHAAASSGSDSFQFCFLLSLKALKSFKEKAQAELIGEIALLETPSKPEEKLKLLKQFADVYL